MNQSTQFVNCTRAEASTGAPGAHASFADIAGAGLNSSESDVSISPKFLQHFDSAAGRMKLAKPGPKFQPRHETHPDVDICSKPPIQAIGPDASDAESSVVQAKRRRECKSSHNAEVSSLPSQAATLALARGHNVSDSLPFLRRAVNQGELSHGFHLMWIRACGYKRMECRWSASKSSME